MPGDVRVPYAMSLVAMRNSKLDEAAKYIDEALPSEKTNFPNRRVEFCIDVQRKDKDAQKSDLRKLAEILVADKLAAERDSYQETARWLGSVMGYYAFTETGRSLLPVADRQSLAAYISGLPSGSLATQFDAGKNSVDEMSKALENQLDAARQQSKDKNEAQRDVDRHVRLATCDSPRCGLPTRGAVRVQSPAPCPRTTEAWYSTEPACPASSSWTADFHGAICNNVQARDRSSELPAERRLPCNLPVPCISMIWVFAAGDWFSRWPRFRDMPRVAAMATAAQMDSPVFPSSELRGAVCSRPSSGRSVRSRGLL